MLAGLKEDGVFHQDSSSYNGYVVMNAEVGILCYDAVYTASF